ncbi:FAD-binding oxidoreductase [Mycolicibacterium mengxianglii]|uniref:FAD-binding oxidoreductase n=1 Tax=Mycolicibacterium mengxianglii TaxID=2736649 RepID=UPI0018EF1581|nr:FAD-binding oxidoreductase [Mycolicibacterium mengxianglii]
MANDFEDRIARVGATLSSDLGAAKVHLGGPGYEDARKRIYNAGIDFAPRLVVTPESAADVRAAVLATTEHDVTLSVLGGGHDWSGRSVRGDVVVDLTRMQQVLIDGDIAVVGGGATIARLAQAAEPHGLAAATGSTGSVGVAGLTLGGGYGPFTGRIGMALDNLLGAEVVLADGRVVSTDADNEPDLLWALRGGGGNFGVVTAMRIRLHTIPSVSAGTIAFPFDQAVGVLNRYGALVERYPDELTETLGFMQGPDGGVLVVLLHAWSGAESEDARVLDLVAGLGDPVLVQVSRQSPAQMLREAEEMLAVTKSKLLTRTVTVSELSTETIEIMAEAMKQRPSPLSYIGMHPFHGAPERIPLESTAFGIRQRHIMIGIFAMWTDDADDENRAWADATLAALRPHALQSAYPNYFGNDRPEQAAVAYGPNADRLLRLKARYDPTGVFAAISLP